MEQMGRASLDPNGWTFEERNADGMQAESKKKKKNLEGGCKKYEIISKERERATET